MTDLRTSVVIDLTGNLERRAQRYGRAINQFSQRGSRDLNRLTRAANAVGRKLDQVTGRYTGAIAGIAAGYAGTRAIVQSGQLDKSLIQITQTAGASREMAAALRAELHTMSEQTGQSLDSLLMGFNNLIQAGLSWEEALATITAINPAMAVTGSQAEILSGALTVAAEAFDFDLSNPEKAVELLDQMTVAGRLGNAELEDLSGIFARVGGNAKAANLSFTDTLGFIERLSLIERNPERLATLADSTLRLFTNQKYLEKAAQVTGVSFYDADDQRREAFDVLEDIAAKYQQLGTDLDRDKAIASAFGEADLDTIRGLRALLGGDAIDQARDMSDEIQKAGGAIARDLPGALENSIDQVSRLKAALRQAADDFAQPVNDAIEGGIKYLMDEQGLSGKEILAGGAVAALGGFALLKGGGKLLKGLGGMGAGVATGKVLEEMAGVQPVYVVNMPGGGMMGMGGGMDLMGGLGRNAKIFSKARTTAALLGGTNIARLGMYGAGAWGMAGLGVTAAGAAGYGIGTLINDQLIEGTELGDMIGEGIARTLAFFGNDEAQQAVANQEKYEEMMRGEVTVRVKADPGLEASPELASADQRLGLSVETETGVNWGAF